METTLHQKDFQLQHAFSCFLQHLMCKTHCDEIIHKETSQDTTGPALTSVEKLKTQQLCSPVWNMDPSIWTPAVLFSFRFLVLP